MTENLIKLYTEKYYDLILHFCLKRTENRFDAEDLASEISLAVITALQRGNIPQNFQAWVWKIARNRYSRWVQKKHEQGKWVSGADLDELMLADDQTVEEDYIRDEMLLILRQELAHLSSGYREVVVAYYMEGKKAVDIARSLSLSEGTVRSKLHRAKQRLKEGMDMTKQLGEKSYRPGNLSFSCSCSQGGAHGQPWSITQNHLLYKNIFLEVYKHPKTAEEISLSLGVALPYLEDELNYLVNETFLSKKGDKYDTTFAIISAEAQTKIHEYRKNHAPEVTALLEEVVESFNAACLAHGISYFGDGVRYEDAKWTLLMLAFDYFKNKIHDRRHSWWSSYPWPERPDGGRWVVTGFEPATFAEPPFVGHHTFPDENYFGQLKFFYQGIEEKTPLCLSNTEYQALREVCEGKDGGDEETLRKLCGYGYLRQEGEKYHPAILVFPREIGKTAFESFGDGEKKKLTALSEKMQEILEEEIVFTRETLIKDLPTAMQQDQDAVNYVCTNSGCNREYVFEQAIADGYLRCDENTSPAVGAHIRV